jgi:polysaccharide deacetylase family protein (PEP-CTERM system associated)
MSIDVEDYFHVSAFSSEIDRADWPSMESRVTRNTREMLELFDNFDVKSTFFVLGCVAEQFPTLVKEIAAEGHEIACHGYSHKLIYEQSQSEFESETRRAKQILEDITGNRIRGYRAASYSITRNSLWALDVLANEGFDYDSSIFPVVHDRYGIPGAPTSPYQISLESGSSLTEVPLTTLGLPGYRLPIAGGGYFRIFPYALTKLAYKYLNSSKNEPVIFYLHPWEIDPEQPRIDSSRFSAFRHYTNLAKTKGRLERLMSDFAFSTVADVIDRCQQNSLEQIEAADLAYQS